MSVVNDDGGFTFVEREQIYKAHWFNQVYGNVSRPEGAKCVVDTESFAGSIDSLLYGSA